MAADPLLALQQHFESEYGKLELPKQSKKRKRNATAVDPAPKPTPTTEEDQDREWKGIENPVLENVREPEVVTFHDSTSINEDVVGGSYRAFMVEPSKSLNEANPHFSLPRRQKQPVSRRK